MPNPTVKLETSLGTITAELFLDAMPITTRNFQRLVRDGFYDGVHFHRVIRGFMAQTGCPHSRDPDSPAAGTGQSPHGTIRDEFPAAHRLSNEPMTLAMANAGAPDTGSCQFFINLAHNEELDWFSPGPSRHPVFGRVIGGEDVVRKIDAAPMSGANRPRTPIKIVRATTTEPEVAPAKPVAARAPAAAPKAPQPQAEVRRAPAKSDPWSIVGVRRGASAEEVRLAFEERSRAFAPAKLAALGSKERRLAEEELRRLTVAYQIIS